MKNDNFNKLKDQLGKYKSIEDVRTSQEIEDLVSKFNVNEKEYLFTNKRFKSIFEDKLINRIKSKSSSMIKIFIILIINIDILNDKPLYQDCLFR